jgi:hypothetical protein
MSTFSPPSTNVTKLTNLESEKKRIVWGATPEEEKLKAKQLSDEAHAAESLRSPKQIANRKYQILILCYLLWAICYSGKERSPLPALRAFPEKLERMPDIGKAVALSDRLFHFLDRTRVHHQSHSAALGANQVIVVLLRVQQLEVTT